MFISSKCSKYVKKRRKDAIVLPTKFLLGGNIHDPLNLSSLAGDLNQVTPKSSPYPTPKHRTQVEVLIPANINDPLNLNCDDDFDESSLISPKGRRSRKRKRKRTETELSAGLSGAELADCDQSMIANDLKKSNETTAKQKRVSETAKVDKIVSPVIPQGLCSANKYRRVPSIHASDVQKHSLDEASTVQQMAASNEKVETNDKSDKSDKTDKHNADKADPKQLHFRAANAKFQYGNYNRYYGYRNTNHKSDLRLECLRSDWFEGKDVLDIGCNAGHITLAIAKDFKPNKIIGLDIDGKLIKMARKNVRHYITRDVIKNEKLPISLPTLHGPIPSSSSSSTTLSTTSATTSATPSATSTANESASSPNLQFPNNVFFVTANYVLENDDLLDIQRAEFDCILCLSFTKWIHLNWGDIGLKRVFKRMFIQLRPGGTLVLEAQPWPSYKRKKKLTETTLKNFNAIKFKPNMFNEYLLSREIGFTKCELIATPHHPSKGKGKGFRRPIYRFTKSFITIEKSD